MGRPRVSSQLMYQSIFKDFISQFKARLKIIFKPQSRIRAPFDIHLIYFLWPSFSSYEKQRLFILHISNEYPSRVKRFHENTFLFKNNNSKDKFICAREIVSQLIYLINILLLLSNFKFSIYNQKQNSFCPNKRFKHTRQCHIININNITTID